MFFHQVLLSKIKKEAIDDRNIINWDIGPSSKFKELVKNTINEKSVKIWHEILDLLIILNPNEGEIQPFFKFFNLF